MTVRRGIGVGVLCLALAWALIPQESSGSVKERYERSLVSYTVPDVTLVNQDGEPVRLRELVNSGKPVMVDFIYGTCTTICPVLSAGYSAFQRKMGDEAAEKAILISISIDPDHDTPPILREYLQRYGAKPGWDFLTGKREDIVRVMRAFDAYVDNKMNHYPLTLLRGAEGEQWVRIYGLLGSRDLMTEYEKLVR